MRKPTIWLDAKCVQASPALVRSLTPGVLKAKGVFETMRVAKGKVLLLEGHLKRMSRGLKVLGIRRPAWYRTISSNIRELLRINVLTEARVRVMLWEKGGSVHGAIVVGPLEAPTAQQYKEGFKAILTNGHRRNTSEPIKSLDYGIFRNAYQRAKAAGFDEAILLNTRGELVEGSRTNIFLVKNNVLVTPSIRCGCLPGITRQVVLECARKLKIRCVPRSPKVRDLLEADEALLTNALLGIMPLIYIHRRRIGTGKAGPVTTRLSLAYKTRIAAKTDKRRFSSCRREKESV